MARARNIKPSFFTNDELAELEPLARLLFISLWTLADYKGCIIWRDKRIKVQTLPYDNCDINKLAINLDKSGFIRFYSDQENIYIKVVNFSVHQNPHKNEREKGSDIPDFTDDMREGIDFKGNKIISRFIAINPDKNGSDRADSLNLIPDSFNPPTAKQTSRFDDWYLIYPVKKSKQSALKAWEKKKLDSKADDLIEKLKMQIANDSQWNEGIGIPHPSTYLNQERWNDEIQAPVNNQDHRPRPKEFKGWNNEENRKLSAAERASKQVRDFEAHIRQKQADHT